MGGCRCSYRNCTMRSNRNEQVHMFHFPVFDKPRCHQWITNAQKLNFLDLKVSQLKNRVICEHHFKDSDFMNYTRGKLKNDAVPTEDGPYCNKEIQEQEEDTLPINLEDIEYSDRLTLMEKRAHFPVKYGDFLMNDVSEPIVYPITKSPSRLIKKDTLMDAYYNKIGSKNSYEKLSFEDSIPLLEQNITTEPKRMPIEFEDAKESKPIKKPTPISRRNKVNIISEKKICEPVKLKGELHTVSPSIVLKVPNKRTRQQVKNYNQERKNLVDIEIPPVTNAVQVIDNNNIIQPSVTEMGTFNEYPIANQNLNLQQLNLNNLNIENVAEVNNLNPSIIYVLEEMNPVINTNQVATSGNIHVPITTNVSTDMPDISMMTTEAQVFTHTVKTDSPILSTREVGKINASDNSKIVGAKSKVSQQLSLLKSMQSITPTKQLKETSISPTVNKPVKAKLPPNKVAEIIEKRKYNLKLRDIITSCLDKLDEEPDNTKNQHLITVNDNKVGDHLSSGLNVPSSQENIISYFEARLQKMENNLLNKIDQNSNKIVDLKKMIKPSTSKKSTFTQTYTTNQETKKHLYQQISQFLTPEVNSMIYEELFINKFSQESVKADPPKKRKRR